MEVDLLKANNFWHESMHDSTFISWHKCLYVCLILFLGLYQRQDEDWCYSTKESSSHECSSESSRGDRNQIRQRGMSHVIADFAKVFCKIFIHWCFCYGLSLQTIIATNNLKWCWEIFVLCCARCPRSVICSFFGDFKTMFYFGCHVILSYHALPLTLSGQ